MLRNVKGGGVYMDIKEREHAETQINIDIHDHFNMEHR